MPISPEEWLPNIYTPEDVLSVIETVGELTIERKAFMSIFDGWDLDRLDAFAQSNDLIIMANRNSGFTIKRVRCPDPLPLVNLGQMTTEEATVIAAIAQRRSFIRAEVEAMDWPEVLDG